MNPWLEARNILAVRLDNIGDAVMVGPALRAVKETSPDARLTLLATPGGATAAPLLPWVDDVLVWRPVWQAIKPAALDPGRERELIDLLAGRGFDAALVFTSFSQTPHVPGYVCYLAGIPLRAGESKEFGGATLTTELRGAPDELHQVERNLRLVESLGFRVRDRRMAVAIPDEARRAVPGLLASAGLAPDAPYRLLHPGASARARRYPADRFGAVARGLLAAGQQVLVTGVEGEAETVAAVAAEAPGTGVLVGGASLAEYAALIERAALVLCGNTLPLHLADAVGTPVLALYSGTDLEAQWRPRAVPARLLRRPTPCHPCYLFGCPIGLPCLDIPPEEVVAEAEALLAAIVSGDGAASLPPSFPGRPGGRGISSPQPRRLDSATPFPGPSELVAESGVADRQETKSLVPREDGEDGRENQRREPSNQAVDVTPQPEATRIEAAGEGPPIPIDPAPRRIAVFRALFLGDLLCATPALRALHRRFPDAEITLIGLPWSEAFVTRLPYLGRFLPFPGYPSLPEVGADAEATRAFVEQARAEPFDLVVQMHGSGGVSNGLIRDLGARRSLGFATGPDQRLTDALPWVEEEHEVRRWLRLVAALGAPVDDLAVDWPVAPDERARAEALLGEVSGDGPLVGLHAGAKDPARRWPADRFAAVGDALAERYGARIVLTGGEGERDVVAAVRGAMRSPALDLAGATDLGSFAAVIAGLDLLVTNDTGASHLAATTGTRSVVLFGPSRPSQWAPLDRARHRAVDALALAPPGTDAAQALADLPIGPVLAACDQALNRRPVLAGEAFSSRRNPQSPPLAPLAETPCAP